MTPYEGEFDLRVATLAELGARSHDPVGIRVLVAEDRAVYASVGRTTDEIAERLGWERRHVWMPDHVLTYIREKHPVLVDPVAIANQLLMLPDAIHQDDRNVDGRIFIVAGSRLRTTGHIRSGSVRYVDGIIEERQVTNGSILRMFHLSPRSRHSLGERIWP